MANKKGIPVGLLVTFLGLGGLTLFGALRKTKKPSGEGTKGLRDLPTHYPYYPRVMPSHEVPDQVHRDAQILQSQEVNAAGKVLLSEEFQPVQHEDFLPNFETGEQPELTDNPFEWGMGTTKPEPYYPPEFEAVNATFEHVEGLNMEGPKMPSDPKHFMCMEVMSPALEREEDSRKAIERVEKELVAEWRSRSRPMPGTEEAEEEEAEELEEIGEGEDLDFDEEAEFGEETVGERLKKTEEEFEELSEELVEEIEEERKTRKEPARRIPVPGRAPAPKKGAPSPARKAGPQKRSRRIRRKGIIELAEMAEYDRADVREFEDLEGSLLNGSL